MADFNVCSEDKDSRSRGRWKWEWEWEWESFFALINLPFLFVCLFIQFLVLARWWLPQTNPRGLPLAGVIGACVFVPCVLSRIRVCVRFCMCEYFLHALFLCVCVCFYNVCRLVFCFFVCFFFLRVYSAYSREVIVRVCVCVCLCLWVCARVLMCMNVNLAFPILLAYAFDTLLYQSPLERGQWVVTFSCERCNRGLVCFLSFARLLLYSQESP